ncbi:MAG: IS200/IS605 family transposase [Halanaerobiales bacterium]|nr:IS200/IS605 family transposase [Halanaerobiales bacterium]
MMNLHKGRGYVYSIQYHIVWCVKYRYKVLIGAIEKRLKEMLYQIAENKGFTIVTMECDKNHIHLLVDCSPQHFIPDMLKSMKGTTARLLFKEFPQLKSELWEGHLWNPSYFVATVSENTREQIEQYINSQKQKTR